MCCQSEITSSNNKTLNARLLAETQVCHRSYIIAARNNSTNLMVYGETGRPYLYQHEIKDFKFLEYWLLNVNPMLDISGLSYVWNPQNVLNKFDIKVFIKQIVHDQFIYRVGIGVKPLIHQSELRTYCSPFSRKKFFFFSLCSIVKTTEWNGMINADNWS